MISKVAAILLYDPDFGVTYGGYGTSLTLEAFTTPSPAPKSSMDLSAPAPPQLESSFDETDYMGHTRAACVA